MFRYSYKKHSGGHKDLVKMIKSSGSGWQLKKNPKKQEFIFTLLSELSP